MAFSFASAQEVDFDIDPQATDQTLLEIAEVGEVQIVFVPDAVEQSESPEVRGSQSVQSAIETSLDTTELVYEFKARNFVVVKPENATAPQPMAVVQNSGAEPVLLAQLQPSEEPDAPAGGATASDTEEPPPDPDLRPVDEIVVTGTRLRDSSPTSPVQVFSMTDMERMGINSVEGFVRALPQNTRKPPR
ncbi:MAG: STN domain-containing protein [Gammaproteobacteria bacterium]|nr:STN domain-containing protein [Gammaproteobacteria bacterium]